MLWLTEENNGLALDDYTMAGSSNLIQFKFNSYQYLILIF